MTGEGPGAGQRWEVGQRAPAGLSKEKKTPPATPGLLIYLVLCVCVCVCVCGCVCEVTSVMSDSVRPYGLCGPPGSSVHEILQAGIPGWVAMPSSMGSF